jgi:nicotinamide-nucleotide amidase
MTTRPSRDGADPLAAAAVALLVARTATVAVAESLTGGLVAAALTSVPGSSAVFRGGVVAYATPLKAELLGVSRGLLDARGAVDPQVAEEMAAGARQRLGATFGAATTGVAGPGPAEGKPAGTVYIAVSGPDGGRVEPLSLAGGRLAIRQATVQRVLSLLLTVLREAGPAGEWQHVQQGEESR